MPLRGFWVFCGAIDRISAANELRQLQVLGAAQGGDNYRDTVESLLKELGKPSVYIDNRRDPEAMNKLRNMLSG